MIIKKLTREEITDALPLVFDVFCKYEAVNYPESGKKAFYNAIHSPEYLDMLTAYGAFCEEKLIGIIAARNGGKHIALFFVDGKHHRQGVGRSLFEEFLKENENSRITVHSSQYAEEVYKKLGFVPEGKAREDGGIIYIPMAFERRNPFPEAVSMTSSEILRITMELTVKSAEYVAELNG